MALEKGSIARRLQKRRKRGADPPSKFCNKVLRSASDVATAEQQDAAARDETAQRDEAQREESGRVTDDRIAVFAYPLESFS